MAGPEGLTGPEGLPGPYKLLDPNHLLVVAAPGQALLPHGPSAPGSAVGLRAGPARPPHQAPSRQS